MSFFFLLPVEFHSALLSSFLSTGRQPRHLSLCCYRSRFPLQSPLPRQRGKCHSFPVPLVSAEPIPVFAEPLFVYFLSLESSPGCLLVLSSPPGGLDVYFLFKIDALLQFLPKLNRRHTISDNLKTNCCQGISLPFSARPYSFLPYSHLPDLTTLPKLFEDCYTLPLVPPIHFSRVGRFSHPC